MSEKHTIFMINSNFVHKAYDGFEEFINRPKKLAPSKKKLIAIPGYKERKKIGDGTCFQSCLEFIVLIDDKTYKMCYFPRSGELQVFGVIDEKFHSGEIAVEYIIDFLKHSGLSEFESVGVVSHNLSLLNYKFNVILPKNTLIDISKIHDIISSDNFPSPFPIDYVSNPLDGIHKLSIKFNASGKNTYVLIWPLDSNFLIYDYLNSIFSSEIYNLFKTLPIPDKK
ncbi:10331_t:CDS:2 [Entrophospora sp. SA101]|nr:10331_t:CDS:2 [Entrophospora sp. SA101]